MHYPPKILLMALLCLILNLPQAEGQTQAGLLVSQSATDTWNQGERTSLELGMSFNTKQQFEIDTLQLNIDFQFALGVIYESLKESKFNFVRPTDNKLFAEGVLKYPLGWTLDPFISASFNTQITESFIAVQNTPKATSTLWDPVVSQQSIGLAYAYKDGKDIFGSRIGISLKQTRADTYTTLTDDRTTSGIIERYKPESGIQWKTNCTLQLDSLVTYKSTLEFFGTFKEPEIWTFSWQNEFQIKLWKFFSILFKADCNYDEAQATRMQYKQSFRFGIVVSI